MGEAEEEPEMEELAPTEETSADEAPPAEDPDPGEASSVEEPEELPVLKKPRLDTGIEELDVVLEGGYSNPANIIAIGPAGMEKIALAMHFIAAAGDGETAYIITADATPDAIKEKAASIGIPLPAKTKFIDCYSSTLGKSEAQSVYAFVPGPGALNDLSLEINEAIRASDGKRIRVVFYSLSTFMLYNPQDSILKFLQVVGGRLKRAHATTLMLVEEGVHDSKLLGIVGHAVDHVYTIRDQNGSLVLEIPEVGVPLPIKIGPTGIMVL